jgi:hypothetical protein
MKKSLMDKVMKLLLLQEVHDKKQMSKELKLTDFKINIDTSIESKAESPRGGIAFSQAPPVTILERTQNVPVKLTKFQKDLKRYEVNPAP